MAEGEIEINGGIVVYEFVGPDDGEVVVLTPGGRFSKDFGGVHGLAYALAEAESEYCCGTGPTVAARTSSCTEVRVPHARGDLGTMLASLGVDQVIATGGSGGARDTMIFTLMWPELVRKMAVWHIVGGTYSHCRSPGCTS